MLQADCFTALRVGVAPEVFIRHTADIAQKLTVLLGELQICLEVGHVLLEAQCFVLLLDNDPVRPGGFLAGVFDVLNCAFIHDDAVHTQGVQCFAPALVQVVLDVPHATHGAIGRTIARTAIAEDGHHRESVVSQRAWNVNARGFFGCDHDPHAELHRLIESAFAGRLHCLSRLCVQRVCWVVNLA